MTPKTFFTLFFKIIGVLLLKDFIVPFQYTVQIILGLGQNPLINESIIWNSAIHFGLLSGLIFFTYFCLFKSEKIITLLRLDKGFAEEKFDITISGKSILLATIVILGGYVILSEVPWVIKNIYYSNTTPIIERSGSPDTFKYKMIESTIRIILALLVIVERNPIVNFLWKEDKI